MKLLNHIIRLGAVCGLLFMAVEASAQSVQLKVMEWNIRSFEPDGYDSKDPRPIDKYIELINTQNPDVIFLNEFMTSTSEMEYIEKLTEMATRLSMYPYYIMSYPKGSGYYGNGILSKYPIINAASKIFDYKNARGEEYTQNSGTLLAQYGSDQRSVGYVDILVPTSENDGKIVRMICSHFDQSYDSSVVRPNQSRWTVEFAGLSNPEYPAVLMGDLNTSGEGELGSLYGVGDFIGYGSLSGFFTGLDNMFCFPKSKWTKVSFQTIDGKINGVRLSDHAPVVSVVTLN